MSAVYAIFILCNIGRLSTLKSTVYTTRYIKKPYTVLPETYVVDKSVHVTRSSTGVCRANVCYADHFT